MYSSNLSFVQAFDKQGIHAGTPPPFNLQQFATGSQTGSHIGAPNNPYGAAQFIPLMTHQPPSQLHLQGLQQVRTVATAYHFLFYVEIIFCRAHQIRQSWQLFSQWFQWNHPISTSKLPHQFLKVSIFPPIFILFLPYSHIRSSHVPEIWPIPIQGLIFNILLQTCWWIFIKTVEQHIFIEKDRGTWSSGERNIKISASSS